jgi:hypothetical protein
MKKLATLIMMSAFLASGCTTIIDSFPKVEVGSGKHCPPGQAKKGRC